MEGLLSNTLSLTFWLNYQSNASNYMSLLNYYIILYLAKLLKWFTIGGFSLRPNNQSQWLRSEVCWSAWPFCLSTRLSAKKRENKYVLICSHVDSYFQWITFHQFPHHFHIIFTLCSPWKLPQLADLPVGPTPRGLPEICDPKRHRSCKV